jgi:hypothetical protein
MHPYRLSRENRLYFQLVSEAWNGYAVSYFCLLQPIQPLVQIVHLLVFTCFYGLPMMKKSLPFLIVASVFFVLIFLLEHINGRFWLNDFKVYYEASTALLQGKSAYGVHFGLDTGFYKYSPFILLLFTVYCVFSFAVASVIHFVLISLAAVLTILLLQYLVLTYYSSDPEPMTKRRHNTILILALLSISNHLVRELHLGNVNMLLLGLVTLTLFLVSSDKPLWAGMVLALAILVKPYCLILLLPIFLYKKSCVLYSTIASLVLLTVITILPLGWNSFVTLHMQWFAAMQAHSEYLSSSDTLAAQLKHYLIPQASGWLQPAVLLVTVICYLGFFTAFRIFGRKVVRGSQAENSHFTMGYFILFALIPNLLITDSEHFLFTLPLIVILMHALWKEGNLLLSAVFVILLFLYGCNSSDLIGNKLSDVFEKAGVLGFSNMGLVALSLFMFVKKSGVQAKAIPGLNDKTALVC